MDELALRICCLIPDWDASRCCGRTAARHRDRRSIRPEAPGALGQSRSTARIMSGFPTSRPAVGITELCGARTETWPAGMKTGDAISPPGGYKGGGMQMLVDRRSIELAPRLHRFRLVDGFTLRSARARLPAPSRSPAEGRGPHPAARACPALNRARSRQIHRSAARTRLVTVRLVCERAAPKPPHLWLLRHRRRRLGARSQPQWWHRPAPNRFAVRPAPKGRRNAAG
jgi:hypothetical protein